MTSYRPLAALAPLAIAFSIVAAPEAEAQAPANLPDIVEGILPGTVAISAKAGAQPAAATEGQQTPQTQPFQVPPGSPFEEFFKRFAPTPPDSEGGTSIGSGYVINGQECLIVTNNHVVENGKEFSVEFPDGTTYKAELVGRDPALDVGVLRCKNEGVAVPEVTFGDSDALRVGQPVVAIGNPFGLSHTVTYGIVSALGRDIQAGPFDNFIQTDTAINRGNSGGALFNFDGEVIGMNTAIFSPTGGSVGIGFAIPANMVKPVVEQIIAHGEVRRGMLGVQISNMTPEKATELGLSSTYGAIVSGVTAGSPSAAAGLKAGDVILKFNGEQVDSTRELTRLAAGTEPGTQVEVTYLRDGREATTQITMGLRNEEELRKAVTPDPKPVVPAP